MSTQLYDAEGVNVTRYAGPVDILRPDSDRKMIQISTGYDSAFITMRYNRFALMLASLTGAKLQDISEVLSAITEKTGPKS